MKSVIERLEIAQAQCAEFFADMLIDPYRGSIIVNVDTEYFDDIGKMIIAQGFCCFHITEFETSITACFILVKH